MRDVKVKQKKDVDANIKKRLENFRLEKKITIPKIIFYWLLIACCIAMVFSMINFLIILRAIRVDEENLKNKYINKEITVFIMNTLIIVLFAIITYLTQTKYKIGNFYVIFWSCLWIIIGILPFILDRENISALTICFCVVSLAIVLALFILFYLIFRHREINKYKYYQNKLRKL